LTQLDFTGPQQVLARLPQSAMYICKDRDCRAFRLRVEVPGLGAVPGCAEPRIFATISVNS
jgi:hypothetical protein